MKSWIFACFFVFLALFLPLSYAEAETNISTYIVTGNSAVVFKEASLESEKLQTLDHKDEVEIECESGEAVVYAEKFAKATNLGGYILKDLIVKKENYLQTIPSFNAKTNQKATVYFLENEQYVASETTLEKHTQIFLYEGYNSKIDYNAVAFYQNNEVVYGFLKTDAIDPDGVNPVIITVILAILAVLGIVFAIVFMKKNPNKNKEKIVKNK